MVIVATRRISSIDSAIVSTATAERGSRKAEFRSAAELRKVLERLLETADSDERIAPILRAARLRARFEFTDRDVALNVASMEDGEQSIEWTFARRPTWTPKVTLRMESAVANRWLQGEESLAIAMARGRVRCTGETKSTLLFVPIAKLLSEPYRQVLKGDFEHLQLD
jgi:hypothetical protein